MPRVSIDVTLKGIKLPSDSLAGQAELARQGKLCVRTTPESSLPQIANSLQYQSPNLQRYSLKHHAVLIWNMINSLYTAKKGRCCSAPPDILNGIIDIYLNSRELILDSGRFQVPEGLFHPEAWGLDHPGVQKLVSRAIQECGVDIRKEMSRSIFLAGGVTMLPGFAERLEEEVNRLTPSGITPKVHASPYRYHAAYLGASEFASSPAFDQQRINLEDWKSIGPNVIRKWKT
ncbi:actin, alpha skeletal muscle-like [Artemia franciscana]|uniref:actin, alpha skeletal muscle-like n=1 Tax=Artemia franciscana TaxID=6661 RepID=UPI0032DAA230